MKTLNITYRNTRRSRNNYGFLSPRFFKSLSSQPGENLRFLKVPIFLKNNNHLNVKNIIVYMNCSFTDYRHFYFFYKCQIHFI